MQKLEPWSVTGVKVFGGVELFSAIANDLPVSEDHDVIVGVEDLKAPLISTKKLVMLIGVFSAGNNFDRRMALRRSWMQYDDVRSGKVAVRFFIGLVSELFDIKRYHCQASYHMIFRNIILFAYIRIYVVSF